MSGTQVFLGTILLLLLWSKSKLHWKHYAEMHDINVDNLIDYVERNKDFRKSFIKSARFYLKFILPFVSYDNDGQETVLSPEVYKITINVILVVWWIVAISLVISLLL